MCASGWKIRLDCADPDPQKNAQIAYFSDKNSNAPLIYFYSHFPLSDICFFSHRCAACVIMGAWSMLPYSTALQGLSKCKYLSHTCKHLYSFTVAHVAMMLCCSYPGPSLLLLTRGQCACSMFNCFHYNTSTDKHRSSHVFTLCDGFELVKP